MTWTSDLVVPAGHQMTFKDALHILSSNLILKLILPGWAKYFSKQARKIDLAFMELKVCHPDSSQVVLTGLESSMSRTLKQQYMMEMVEARRNGDKVEQRYDLFSGLLDATQDAIGTEAALHDDELMGEYLTLQSFGLIGKRLTCPRSKHVCISFCWT